MKRFVKSRQNSGSDVTAVLLGVCLSLIALGGYVSFEYRVIRPAQEIDLGYDTPGLMRQLVIIVLFCFPTTFGAVIAAWLASRPKRVASCVAIAYVLIVFAPLFSDDNLPYPLPGVVGLQPWVTLSMLLVNLAILPVAAAAATTRIRTALTATG
ncbi:MAG TPA: hypothetical protein PLR44_11760 [Thermomicrobiales bacterium]|jgi:hypothetical protein|uniref:hypothetical protein n=1 Tax=Gordonia sp. UBA5067 TaxID=1946575 RepID=UPI0025BC1440|nr:hypothetical protein [Gordonia sp. UBA5067]HQZ90718.1 hypothetical protein [Thermomicrobiales bacterium]HRA31408.1 hypothetical protein [Thermomicrobiales bacterium]